MGLKNLKIRSKVICLVGVISFSLIISIMVLGYFMKDLANYSITKSGDQTYQGFKMELKAAVDPVSGMYGELLKDFKTEKKQVDFMQKYNQNIRFFEKETGYLFILKKGGTVVSIPIRTDLHGKNIIGLKDSNNKHFIKELDEKAFNGGGFVEYMWNKPGVEGLFKKLSYAARIPGTDFWLGTGVYIDMVDEIIAKTEADTNEKLLSSAIWGGGLILAYILLIMTPLTIIIIRFITGPIDEITQMAHLAKVGDYSRSVLYESGDELGILADAFNAIAKRQGKLAGVAQAVAKGDLTAEVQVDSENDKLGQALNRMIRDLNVLVREIVTEAKVLSGSSFKLSDISNQVVDTFQSMNIQTDSAAGSTVEMSSNISTMAAGSEEISSNIHAISASSTQLSHNTSEVLSSVENISDSIKHVAQKSENASTVAADANQMAQNAVNIVGALSQSANEIGEVTNMIKEIAQQTNLLALNANIEAASAGEAGKGFSVVANEIKELANQSANAATNIGDKINHIQGETRNAVDIFTKVSDVVDMINENSGSITELTFKQHESANIVTLNVQEAAKGIEEIAKMIEEMAKASQELSKHSAELTQGSGEISKNVAIINEDTKKSSKAISNIQSESSELSNIAVKLETLVQRFTLKK